MNNEVVIKLVALVKEHQALLKEQQSQLDAYRTAIHSMLQHHPNLDVIASDYMTRMDNLAITTSPERLAEIREDWQRVLFSMTEELARRKSSLPD